MFKRLAIALIILHAASSAIAQIAVGDFVFQKRTALTGPLTPIKVTPTNGYVFGLDGSGNLVMVAAGGGGTWGSITGTLANQTDLNTALGLKAPLASPTFTGTVTLPTGTVTSAMILDGTIAIGDLATAAKSTGGNDTDDSGKLVVFDGNGGITASNSFAVKAGPTNYVAYLTDSFTAYAESVPTTIAFPSAPTVGGTVTIPTDRTGTLITTGDTGTVTNTMLANSSITINGTPVSLGGSTTISTGITIGTTATSGASANDIITSNGTVVQKLTPGTGVTTWIATPTIANLNTVLGSTLATTGANTFTGVQAFTPTARTSGSASYYTLTTPADTGLTASTESIGMNLTAATRTFATGAITEQRERVFAAPTYSFVGASTISDAVNVDIADPIAGTNATLTRKYALRAASAYVSGTLTVGPSKYLTFSESGAISTLSSPTGYITIVTGGNTRGTASNNGWSIPANQYLCFGTINAETTFLSQKSAAAVQMGKDVDGDAVDQTFKAADGITGKDRNGGDLTLASGNSTGTGTSALVFSTPAAGSTGTTARTAAERLRVNSANVSFTALPKLPAYTVATLPSTAATGMVQGAEAIVTDATAPTYLGALTGGGAVVCPVFYNGSAWVSH